MDKRGLMESVVALILAAIVAVSLLSFSNSYLATDTPQVAVTTGSMLPVYNGYQDTPTAPVHPFRGDLLVIKGETEYHVGDVIVFDDPRDVVSIPIVHRIIDIKTENGQVFYKTKGDNNVVADPFWVPKENVHGRVILRVPHVGWLSLLMRTDPYRYIVIAAIGVLILVSTFRSEDEEEDEGPHGKKEDNSESMTEESTLRLESQSREKGILGELKSTLSNPTELKKLVVNTLKNGYVLIIIGVLVIYFAGNAMTWGLMNNEVFISIEENGQMLSVDGHAFNLNEPGVNSWDSNGSIVFGLYTVVTIKSSGFFDWVHRIDFTTNSDLGLEKTVSWTVVYAWSGEKVIDWFILVAFPATLNLTSAFNNPVSITLEVTMHSAGLLASSPITKAYTIFLEE